MVKLLRLILVVVLIGIIGRAVFLHLANDRGLPATEGILNFGRIDDHLYRGAQPDAAGIARLKQLGVTTIINLRTAKEIWSVEAAAALSNSIVYTNIPLEGMGRPTQEEMARILSVINGAPGPVFVHCAHGCDRTGTVIACYRIQHDGWDAAAALKEANRYGLSILERGMREYVSDFARLATNATLLPK
jgi:protein tyrosine/serine phosphatase